MYQQHFEQLWLIGKNNEAITVPNDFQSGYKVCKNLNLHGYLFSGR